MSGKSVAEVFVANKFFLSEDFACLHCLQMAAIDALQEHVNDAKTSEVSKTSSFETIRLFKADIDYNFFMRHSISYLNLLLHQ